MSIALMFLVCAAIFSIAGAIFNGYGTGIKNDKIIFYGQCSWVISNTLWIILYVCMPGAVALLPPTFQLITFGTFQVCATYSVLKSCRKI